MTNSKFQIREFDFNENTPRAIKDSNFPYKDWPVVYLIDNDEQLYIGETIHPSDRMKQHWENSERRKLKNLHIIASSDFTKSSTLDIESSLIELCSAKKGKRELQNVSNGVVTHNYANKKEFSQTSSFFTNLWYKLKDLNLVEGDIEDLKNTDLFKYSPFKALNGEQATARDFIISKINEKIENNKKGCIVVEGGAGTGKTILAIYLMKLFITNADYIVDENVEQPLAFINDLRNIRKNRPNLKIGYVVSMTSLRNTLGDVFKEIKGLSKNMVISPSEVQKQHYDILIVDEAHRLKKRKNLSSPGDYSNFDKTNKALGFKCNKNEEDGNQLDWIVKQSDYQIFFYDKNQSVKPTDIDASYFESYFNKCSMDEHKLTSQMRCMGGIYYTEYIDSILKQTAQPKEINNYDFRLFENINDFCDAMLKKEKEYELCRIVSGYGFEWISKVPEKNEKPNPYENVEDINIENRKFFWNKKSKCWPTSIEGERIIKEVGCIHTIQGYDLNYCGVIFGPEIVFRNNQIEIVKEKYYDANGKTGASDKELKDYIINIYSVLMTRGIKGTYVYVCDEKLREYLKKYIITK